jgi:dihydropteroate synthase
MAAEASSHPAGTAPLVMGVLNVTPDSFSDGGLYLDAERAVDHGLAMARSGADVVDVGGESSRPGAEPVSEREELARVVPVIEALSPHVRVSVDTVKRAVAEAAIGVGATLVNDISASLWPVAVEGGVGWVAMHMQGEPGTMQRHPHYDDVVAEVRTFLRDRAEAARRAGVGEVWVDPGIGFGKTTAHNLALLRHLPELVADGAPVVVGTSRKSFLGRLAPGPDGEPGGVAQRLPGSIATATWAMLAGASMVRVHDVAGARQAATLVGATRLAGPVPSGPCGGGTRGSKEQFGEGPEAMTTTRGDR